jgi:hypothetical protein
MFRRGHMKWEDMSDTLADAVCDVIGKGVVQLINNGGGNAPQPLPNKKQKVAQDMRHNRKNDRQTLATPGTLARATSSDNNKSDRRTSEWDQWKAAFLGPLAILWEKNLDVLMQTPVRTVLLTAKLNTPGTTVEELKIDQQLLDGGQGKIEEGDGEPQTMWQIWSQHNTIKIQ